MKERIKKVTTKVISNVALTNAKKEADSTCLCIGYQPTVPKELKNRK